MNDLQIFSSSEFGNIRTVTVDSEPWFVGKDIAEALGYKEPTKAARERVDEEDKGMSKIDTPSGVQNMVIINESGLYSLILSSKLSNAKKFKHWVTSEVLPSIRKTGAYGKQNTETDKLIKCAEIMAGCLSSNQPYVLNIIRHIVPDVDKLNNELLSSLYDEPVTDDNVQICDAVGGRSYKKPFNHNQFNNYLIEHGIKNYWVEAELKCSQGLVRKWRYGLSNPTEHYRIKLCEVLNLPIGYFDNSKRVRRIQTYE